MRTLNVTFTDAEYKRLLKAKRSLDKFNNYSWHAFILRFCANGVRIK
jgi:hypothetical protein